MAKISATLALILVLTVSDARGASHGWIPVEHDEHIPFDLDSTPIQIQTAAGSNGYIWVRTYNEEPSGEFVHLGTVAVRFSSPVRYYVYPCNDWTDLPIQPSAEVEKIWMIAKTTESLIIFCNGVRLLKYEFSESNHNRCNERWGVDADVADHIVFGRFSDLNEVSKFYQPYLEVKKVVCTLEFGNYISGRQVELRALIRITNRNTVEIDWVDPDDTDGEGEINYGSDPATGWVEYPDRNRRRNFWYYPAEGIIYWHNDKGPAFYEVVQRDDCKGSQLDRTCTDVTGTVYQQGESYQDGSGKRCTCQGYGIIECACTEQHLRCGRGLKSWTDDVTCATKCIPDTPGFCSSSGDPHYRTFDKNYYDFHGACTYQAASCDNFVVNFKNVDLGRTTPRYTERAELEFKGRTYSIGTRYSATVDGTSVQLPYTKIYTNGDKVSIVRDGQLTIILEQKSRSPAVKIQALQRSGGRYIDAKMWLHGSCASLTEGMCGNFNGNKYDDLLRGSRSRTGQTYERYDEDCPAPPAPYHPCDDIADGHNKARLICDDLLGAPFSSCHDDVPVGDKAGGAYFNCLTDVCHCLSAGEGGASGASCACDEFDNYVDTCHSTNKGHDLSDWRQYVSYCPYECPDGLVYQARGAVPTPSCLDRNPEQTGTQRGCFCPEGKFLQDNICIESTQCKCLHEGQFYEFGDSIVKEGTCQECRCEDFGEMVCSDKICPALNCAADEIEATDDEKCCPYCVEDWVRVVGANEKEVEVGQSATFTVKIMIDGVTERNKVWRKGGRRLDTVSNDRLTLTLTNCGIADSGFYEFTATKGRSSMTVSFFLVVHERNCPLPTIANGVVENSGTEISPGTLLSLRCDAGHKLSSTDPVTCISRSKFSEPIPTCQETCMNEHGDEFGQGESYDTEEGKRCTCQKHGVIKCSCIQRDLDCPSGQEPWTDETTCEKICIPEEPGYCYSSGDPHYKTFDGKLYDFHGMCTYQAASCGNDFEVNFKNVDFYNKAPRYTERAELIFNGKTFAIHNGRKATVDGQSVKIPYTKAYQNGDEVSIQINGHLEIILKQTHRSPAVRIRATDIRKGTAINAEVWLHGSCAGKTDGMCGNYNGNADDDLEGEPNAHGLKFRHYDEDCEAPPEKPFHPCDDIDNGHERAAEICDDLTRTPFSPCNEFVGAEYHDQKHKDCLTDVCHCMADPETSENSNTCACSEFSNYAEQCQKEGFGMQHWRQDISYCGVKCPDGQIFLSTGRSPAPTCQDRNPAEERKVEGCFCPDGKFLQDDICVDSTQCKCLHEGVFYEPRERVIKEASCETCVCSGSGGFVCEDLACPELDCASDEVKATDEEACCPFCVRDWLRAPQPVTLTREIGQDASFTAVFLVGGVKKEDKVWTKEGETLTGESADRKSILKLTNLKTEDSGTYQFTATKGEGSKTLSFTLIVKGRPCLANFMPTVENGRIAGDTDVDTGGSITVECDRGFRVTPANSDIKCITNDGTRNIFSNDNVLPTCQVSAECDFEDIEDPENCSGWFERRPEACDEVKYMKQRCQATCNCRE